jgi:hypothetical protein
MRIWVSVCSIRIKLCRCNVPILCAHFSICIGQYLGEALMRASVVILFHIQTCLDYFLIVPLGASWTTRAFLTSESTRSPEPDRAMIPRAQ